ncbi:MAG: hypothetical protein CSA34_00480 [Desulfobulbus propionicus]|nr:MAG: hypothetical protein CSA34_00480 [Desulfobulbus propionicus]
MPYSETISPDLFKALLLGIVQGLTEFLPVSSSGHLVIGQQLLGFNTPGIAFEVFVHLGSLVAVLVAFRDEIRLMLRALLAPAVTRQDDPTLQQAFMWDLYVVVSTLPAVVIGVFFKDAVEQIFDSILVTCVMLVVTGISMLLTRVVSERQVQINCPRALFMGIGQAFAILPGLSRSGTTIFTGMLLGVNRETAARFSFIMSIPAILGAAVLKLKDLVAEPLARADMLNLAVATLAAAVSGYIAIFLLMGVVRKGKLHWFGYYCFFVSFVGLLWYFLV